MADITRINSPRRFSYTEALALVPVLRRITQETVMNAERLALRYEALPEGHPAREELELELAETVLAWAAKVQKLGGDPKGLWLVDLTGTSGTWGWRYPDEGIEEVAAAGASAP